MGVIVCDKESDSILDVRLLTAFSLNPFFSNYGQHMDKLMKKTNQPTNQGVAAHNTETDMPELRHWNYCVAYIP